MQARPYLRPGLFVRLFVRPVVWLLVRPVSPGFELCVEYRVPARLAGLPLLQPRLLGLEYLEGRLPVLLELRRRHRLVLPLLLEPMDLAQLRVLLTLLVLWCQAQAQAQAQARAQAQAQAQS